MTDEILFSFYDDAHEFFVSDGRLHFASLKPSRSVSVRQLFHFIKHDERTRLVTETFHKMTDEVVPSYVKKRVKVDDFEALALPPDVPTYRSNKPDKDGVLWVHYAEQDGTTSSKKLFKTTRFAFVQAAGQFSQRRSDGLVSPSGLWCVDFDHFADSPEQIRAAKDALLNDDNVRPCLVFTSPSGDGLKAFVLFDWTDDEAERKARLRGLYKYYEKTFPDWTDKHTGRHAVDKYTDFVHCCNVPHDDDARLNLDAFTRLDWNVWRVDEARPAVAASFQMTGQNEHDKVVWYVNELVRSGIDVTDGMTAEQFAALAASFTEFTDGEDLFLKVSSLWPRYKERNARQTFKGVRGKGRADFRHFVNLAVAALNGRTWEKDSLDGQRATEAFKAAKREEFNASHAGELWREQKQKERQIQRIMTSTNTLAPDVPANAQNTAVPTTTPATEQDDRLTDAELCEIVLKKRTFAELVHDAAQIAVSVPTGYVFGDGYEREPFTLKSQALTVVGAGTSHGKTRFLENVLLRVAEYHDADTSGTCLFFTLEESLADVLAELVNVSANVPDVRHEEFVNNFAAYADAFRRMDTQEARFFPNEEEFANACKYIRNFADKFTETDAVRMFDDEVFRDVDVLCRACRVFASQNKLKAVFLDHLGMMTERGTSDRVARTERVERIVNKLEALAKELNVPFVVSCQTNRQANGFFSLENGNLADSADVERSANTVVLLWNSKVVPTGQTESQMTKRNGVVDTPPALQEHGFFYGVGGALAAKMTKRRGGKRDVWTVFDFNGGTGRIQEMTPERVTQLQDAFVSTAGVDTKDVEALLKVQEKALTKEQSRLDKLKDELQAAQIKAAKADEQERDVQAIRKGIERGLSNGDIVAMKAANGVLSTVTGSAASKRQTVERLEELVRLQEDAVKLAERAVSGTRQRLEDLRNGKKNVPTADTEPDGRTDDDKDGEYLKRLAEQEASRKAWDESATPENVERFNAELNGEQSVLDFNETQMTDGQSEAADNSLHDGGDDLPF